MRLSLIVGAYAAVVVAAPPGFFDSILKRAVIGKELYGRSEDCRRCSSQKPCGYKEFCLGEKEIPDGKGVCVKVPKPCSDIGKDCCPAEGFCVSSQKDGNRCIPKSVGEKVGLKRTKPKPNKVTTKKTTTTCTTTAKSSAKATTSAGVEVKRCNYWKGKLCGNGEVCLGEREFGEQMDGFCIKDPKRCGARIPPLQGRDECPDPSDACVGDYYTTDCNPGIADCGRSKKCLPVALVKKYNLSVKNSYPFRCGGKTGGKCYDNVGEVCVGENKTKDGKGGVCMEYPRTCNAYGGCGQGDWYYCVADQVCMKWSWEERRRLDENTCYKNACVFKTVAIDTKMATEAEIKAQVEQEKAAEAKADAKK
ncbi:hypothetical protein TWF730_008962 [Orbilia blumenaviensis]|uniref:Uncharacterized protein n=1 Tax=Orbilia blumenaviensis TaxID=1796055 RepID=A0AAV9UX05_9PEZI